MKKCILALVLTLSLLPIYRTEALSCVESSPVVGIVDTIYTNGDYTGITLKDYYSLDQSDWEIDDTFFLDRYENIAKDYIENYHKISSDKVSLSLKAVDQTDLKVGDLVVNGPPFHVCNYRFFGVFDSQGKLAYAIVNDNYSDYDYYGDKLEVTSDSDKVEFKLNNESFNLSYGEVYKTSNKNITEITLIDFSISEDSIMDWGISSYATYIMDFRDTEEPEQANFFQKFWKWLTSLW